MLLEALYFVVVLALSLLFYYRTKYPLHVLFFASLFFIAYMQWCAILLLLGNAIFAFYWGRLISTSAKRKQALFVFGVSILLLELIIFKVLLLEDGAWTGSAAPKLMLTLGLSFYTLQHMAYFFDIKIGRIQPEEKAGYYILSAAYFPKLLCGPVITYQNAKKALFNAPIFKIENLVSGANRFAFGAFKKLVLADRLAPMSAAVFEGSYPLHGFTALFGGLLFTLQVYFDFSGYIDMALGISRMFGINLPENFALPLRATSITHFWRRWHMTLMQWLSAYVYYPFSYYFRKSALLSALIGIVLTLFFSAFWHGIGLTFLLWGACHMLYLSIELLAQQRQIEIPKALGWFLTIVAVSFANVFFRAGDLQVVYKLTTDIFSLNTFWPHNWLAGFVAVIAKGGELNDLFNCALAALLVLLFLLFEARLNAIANSDKFNVSWLFSLLLLIAVLGVFSDGEQFIYARF